MALTEWIALSISFFGVISSSLIAFLVYQSTRQSQRAEVQREIANLYDRMMAFRASEPEVLTLSRRWSIHCFSAVYRQSTTEERQWAEYYTYVELAIGFCNAVLSAQKAGMLDRRAYEYQYRNLVRYVLTEHYPYIKTVLHGKYLSKYIIAFIRENEKAGWDWQQNHTLLAESANS